MIFLRPYVVRDSDDSRISNAKYDSMQRRERAVQPAHDLVIPNIVAPVMPDLPPHDTSVVVDPSTGVTQAPRP
jgi:hypothetical protein